MGLPVEKLVVATNDNDILYRALNAGDYSRREVHATISPAMDIQVSSNFERLLFDLYDRDGAAIADMMRRFDSGDIQFSEAAMARCRELFSSQCVSDEDTCAQIAATWEGCEYLLDPHSAIGVRAALEAGVDPSVAMVTLATAHPAKFPAAVASAE